MNARNIFLVLIGLAVAVFVAMVLSGKIMWFSTEPPVEIQSNMDHQFKAIPQSGNTFFSDRKSLREPVEGTVARGAEPYTLGVGDIELAETANVDPNLPDTEFVLARGQNRFNTFCSPCHYYDGNSDSSQMTKRRWENIPRLTAEQAAGYSNARIFHIISAGQGLMPSYADKMNATDRWAVVRYVRHLQKLAGSVPPAPTTQAQ